MEEIRYDQVGYIVKKEDNVGTALGEIQAGVISLRGGGAAGYHGISAVEVIPFGHKFALKDMEPGESVIKYGAVIAVVTRAVKAGEHVHLHNVKSNFDARSATLDAKTADSTDMEYNLY